MFSLSLGCPEEGQKTTDELDTGHWTVSAACSALRRPTINKVISCHSLCLCKNDTLLWNSPYEGQRWTEELDGQHCWSALRHSALFICRDRHVPLRKSEQYAVEMPALVLHNWWYWHWDHAIHFKVHAFMAKAQSEITDSGKIILVYILLKNTAYPGQNTICQI